MTVILRHDGIDYQLPSEENLPAVRDAISAAREGGNGGWAAFPVVRNNKKIDFAVQVLPETNLSLRIEHHQPPERRPLAEGDAP